MEEKIENAKVNKETMNTSNASDEKVSTAGKGADEKKSKRGKLIVIIIGVVFLIFLGYLLYKKLTFVKKVDLKSIPAVNVTFVRRGTIGKEASLIGTILPNNTYYVPAKVAGELKKIYVKNGDYVRKGDPICDIDASKEIEAAFIQYDTARKTYERMKRLFNSGDISAQDFETIKAQYDAAKLSYDTKVEYATPVAVGDGVVEGTDMTINTNVSSGKVLCYITSDEGKEINFGVTERILSGIEIGDKVTVEKNGKIYEAHITNIGNLIDGNTGLFNVKASIVSENDFASGVMAKVLVNYNVKKNAYILSNEHVYYENKKPFVYVVGADNIVTKRYIVVGIENRDECEVLSGIDKSVKIVSTWNSDLAEGTLVKVVKEEKVFDEVNSADAYVIEDKSEIKESEEVKGNEEIKETKEKEEIKETGATKETEEIKKIEETKVPTISTNSIVEAGKQVKKLVEEPDDAEFIRRLKSGELDGLATLTEVK